MPPRIGRIDPELVIVVAARRALERLERLTGVGRLVQRRVARVDDVGVAGVDGDSGEVPAALPDAPVRAREPPANAGVVGRVQAAGLRVDRVDHCIDAPADARSERESDAAELLRREALGDRLPRVAAVRRAVEAAARAVRGRIDVPGRPARLPQRGEDRSRVAGIEGEIDRPGVFVAEEDAGPRLSPVPGAKDAALRIRTVGMAERRDEDEIRILRVHQDFPDLTRVREPQALPGVAAVGGLVHAVAVRDVRAHVGLSGADVEHIRIRGRHGDRSDRRDRLAVEDRLPGAARVVGAPDAAAHRPEVEPIGLIRNTGHREDASAAERPRHPPWRRRKRHGSRSLGREGMRRGDETHDRQQASQKLHARTLPRKYMRARLAPGQTGHILHGVGYSRTQFQPEGGP